MMLSDKERDDRPGHGRAEKNAQADAHEGKQEAEPKDEQKAEALDKEQEEIEQRSSPSGKVVYKTILKEGEEELQRPTSALFWSGLAAGLSMSFSMITEGLLAAYLPPAGWRPLVAKLGYSMGFLLVILGRQQLFTENTLTPILPLLQRKDAQTFANVMRLWLVVLVANLLGGLAVALAIAHTNVFEPHVLEKFMEIGQEAVKPGFGTLLLRGIFAGWLIALMVWLLPFAETARVWVIILVTYVVGVAGFSHIIAGAVEAFTLAAWGRASWPGVVGRYLVPVLAGNIIGGVTLVATLNHAQVVAGGSGEDV
ncbi:MAG TPA: formate/nitrite transporter family protein [Pyrinomonadaceae bacterium]|jgi:formate/nitrite transporter FocA (FNT family)